MQPANLKACCANLYQSNLARFFLGETLHPGGLELTSRLGNLMGILAQDWVVDLASGNGASVIALARAFHCKAVGIEFGEAAVSKARSASLESQDSSSTYFLQGDAESPPFRPSSIDAAVCECSLSIFPDKHQAVREVVQILRPGGKFGISDVTLEPDSLPEELSGLLGRIFCLTDACNVEGYIQLLEQGGLVLLHKEDTSAEILHLLDSLEARLGGLLSLQSVLLSGTDGIAGIIHKAPEVIAQIRGLVAAGKLGYWLFVAQKPGN